MISLHHVTAGYKNKAVVHAVSLSVEPGAIVAILGFNGTGKSTLLRTICGLQPALAGTIQLKNRDLSHYTAIERAQTLAIVLSGRAEMVPALLVEEILAFARSPYQDNTGRLTIADMALIADIGARLEITHLMHRPIYALSDGEAQRVAIARALVQDTPVIALDEPTSHLDLHHKLEIFGLIKSLSAQGKTIIFSSHDIDMSLSVAHAALLLNIEGKGHYGTTTQLIEGGIIAQYFNQEGLQFNQATRRFEYRI